MGILEYDSNNSGGDWWLSDENWKALEEAGWTVHWLHDRNDPSHTHEEPEERSVFDETSHHHGYDTKHKLTKVVWGGKMRWLGAPATSAAIETDDPETTIAEWERITGQFANAEGCNCCGEPHSFSFTGDDGNTKHSHVEVTQTERRWS